jgi:voltage-gated sodium channel
MGMAESARAGRLARFVDSDRFAGTIAAVIVVNAIVLGLETYPTIMADYADVLILLNELCFAVFVVELVLRLASYGRDIRSFFRSGWNVFDLVVIGAVFIPGVREQAQLLRLLRLARIVRLVRFLPDARILLLTVIKSIPSLFSMVVLTVLLLFVYGMIGWSLFGAALPETWGTIGRAMLTLFILLTLENFPTYLDEAEAVSPYAVVFFISYVLLAAFVVFNLLIGIVIGSMERARESEASDATATPAEESPAVATEEDVVRRIRALQADLATLEDAVLAQQSGGVTGRGPGA